jgi:hypothetical protein
VNVTFWPNVEGFAEETSAVLLVALLTTCVTVFDVDVALLPSPLYVAVIECDATLSVDVEHPALPLLKATAAHNVVAPSLNVTLPVGDWPVTVAVNVTFWPNVDGFTEEPSAVLLVALLTTCVTVLDVDVALLPSPLYVAVIECDATLSADVEHPALPVLSATFEQIAVAPSLNVTVPVGD